MNNLHDFEGRANSFILSLNSFCEFNFNSAWIKGKKKISITGSIITKKISNCKQSKKKKEMFLPDILKFDNRIMN